MLFFKSFLQLWIYHKRLGCVISTYAIYVCSFHMSRIYFKIFTNPNDINIPISKKYKIERCHYTFFGSINPNVNNDVETRSISRFLYRHTVGSLIVKRLYFT